MLSVVVMIILLYRSLAFVGWKIDLCVGSVPIIPARLGIQSVCKLFKKVQFGCYEVMS